jgi:hydroxymethylpyrimidine/phosphomethylpyrimidine kinase
VRAAGPPSYDEEYPLKRTLTIAGSDCSGGAGIQADLKTFTAFGTFGMSAVTAVVAENTVGVQGWLEMPVDLIAQQIDSCAEDIGVDACKAGMLAGIPIVEVVAAKVRERSLPNFVVDPVMIAKGGEPLLAEDARSALARLILPLALVVTPNLHEAATLAGFPIPGLAAMREAARAIHALGPGWVVVKGGHLPEEEDAIDLLYDGRDFREYRAHRVDTPHTHGTGCTFSAAITAGLALGLPVPDAVARAKEYTARAIAEAPRLGHGHGPTNHLIGLSSPWMTADDGRQTTDGATAHSPSG